jgi:hypothetical protein
MTNRPAHDDETIHGFDQTNGQVAGLEGESDGTAEGELRPGGQPGDAGREDGQAAPVIAPAGPIHP